MRFKFNIISICLYIYLILKPFYINKSGNLQISDIFIVIAFVFLLLQKKKENNNTVIKRMLNEYKFFLLFILFVFFINIIGYLLYFTSDFIFSILYYIFIAIGIYVFIYKTTDIEFLKNIYYISIFNIIEQFAIYMLGIGKYYSIGRYMGTFNDPNQFGFFIILMIAFIYTIKNILNKGSKIFIISFLIGTFMIFESASTGMILAIFTFIIIQFLCNFSNILKKFKKNSKKIFIAVIIVAIILLFFLIEYYTEPKVEDIVNEVIYNNIINTSIYNRILGKFDKIDSSVMKILEDRHLEQIVDYPQYLIIGAGQGNYERFTSGRYYGEIHSTLPSILFYYGIIPFLVLLYWIYCNLNGVKLKQLSVYIAILVESFTLINQRQLLLWFLIIIANLYHREGEKEKIKNEKDI